MFQLTKIRHPLYWTYWNMVARCRRKSHPMYKYYGERGISVCQRWMADFWSFVEDIGPKPTGYFLDRIDNDGNYEPSNCRWVAPKASANNRRPRLDIHDRIRDELGRWV